MSAQLTIENNARIARMTFAMGPAVRTKSRTPLVRASRVGTKTPSRQRSFDTTYRPHGVSTIPPEKSPHCSRACASGSLTSAWHGRYKRRVRGARVPLLIALLLLCGAVWLPGGAGWLLWGAGWLPRGQALAADARSA